MSDPFDDIADKAAEKIMAIFNAGKSRDESLERITTVIYGAMNEAADDVVRDAVKEWLLDRIAQFEAKKKKKEEDAESIG